MAGVGFITGKRFVDGESRSVFYIASLQDDGYLYFNDDQFYRVKRDNTDLQLFYIKKQIWIATSNITEINTIEFDVAGVIEAVGGLLGGGGAANPNADVETAVKWMINKVSTQHITYSLTNRNLNNPNGTSYDCSSFVITGFNQGGFGLTCTYTGDMRADFVSKGFEWIPGSYFPASQCIRGDVLLNESMHTQVYIGNNQDVNCGSTPARIVTHSADYWGKGWNGILRYKG